MLRRSSLTCDELAPTEASREDLAHWNERQDVRNLRCNDDPRKHDKIRSIFLSLNRLRTREMRQRFFEDANTLRALGEATDTLSMPSSPRATTTEGHPATLITSIISSLLKHHLDGPPTPSREASYVNLLLKYLDPTHFGRPTCFLCLTTCESWDAVWTHSNKKRAAEEIWPLDCPECQRTGEKAPLARVRNLGEWYAHVHKGPCTGQRRTLPISRL